MNNYNFSIIIPNKNDTVLLERCIKSIPVRDDVQVIIVDDNSDESIIDFNKYPGLNLPNYKVIFTKESLGAGYARNVGLKQAEGKWLLFADSDDYYTENISGLLDKYADVDNVDIVYLNAQRVFESTGVTELYNSDKYIKRYLKKKFYAEKILKYGMWTPWTRMVKREVVVNNNLLFDQIPTGNDIIFCLNCSKYSSSFECYEKVVYNYYRPANNSLVGNKRKRIENLPHVVDLAFRHIELERSVNYMCGRSILSMYRKKNNYNCSSYEYIQNLNNLLRDRKYNKFNDAVRYVCHILAVKCNIL